MIAFPESQQCQLDPRCEYAAGHTCECTPVEIGKYVLKKRTDYYAYAYKHRLDTIVAKVKADWFDALVSEGTSPLLLVGWVSEKVNSRSYAPATAGTWHRDRDCKRNRAMGRLLPRLYMDTGRGSSSLTPCAGCGQLADEQKVAAQRDYRRLRELTNAATEGLCLGQYGGCGRDVVPGKTMCAEHAQRVSAQCYEGDHASCPVVLATHTRQLDGGTYTTDCQCQRCVHKKKV
ncbi:MAG TPA: hypothetical protein VFI41_05260 [Gemmatimonadales bacterium]|nr:hypothetical protein [Gemmatimonadales bacterium]